MQLSNWKSLMYYPPQTLLFGSVRSSEVLCEHDRALVKWRNEAFVHDCWKGLARTVRWVAVFWLLGLVVSLGYGYLYRGVQMKNGWFHKVPTIIWLESKIEEVTGTPTLLGYVRWSSQHLFSFNHHHQTEPPHQPNPSTHQNPEDPSPPVAWQERFCLEWIHVVFE
jgi:hypothetical protein